MTKEKFMYLQRTRLSSMRETVKNFKVQINSAEYAKMKLECDEHDPILAELIAGNDVRRLADMEETIAYLARKLEAS